MNIKNRIRRIETRQKQQVTAECSCSGSLVVRPNGETSQLCPACIEHAKNYGWTLIEPGVVNNPADTSGA